ncbi:MAG: response regulator [Spirochaetota bacterium]
MKAPDPLAGFEAEARTALGSMENLLVQASHNPDDKTLWRGLRRGLEGLGADARAAGNTGLAELAAAMGRIPRGLVEGRFRLGPPYLKLLNLVFEYLVASLDAGPGSPAGEPPRRPVIALCERAYNRESFTLKGFSLSEQLRGEKEGLSAAAKAEEREETVEIGVQAVERLGVLLNSVIVHQFQLKKNGDVLMSLETALRELAERIRTGEPPARLLHGAEAALKDLQTLGTAFKEDLAAVDRSSFSLQEEIARLRMRPFQVICERLRVQAAELATRSGKRLELRIEGLGIPLDKTILELVTVPLAELLANAVTHGIAAGSSGAVTLSCSSDGTTISIGVRDEGPGIDWEGIRETASGLFPLEREEIMAMTATQLSRFLFEPGIGAARRAAPRAAGEAGGLRLVKESLDAMRGRIGVESGEAGGSLFSLQIPASVSLVSGFFVRAGGERFFISAVHVREIVIFGRDRLQDLPSGPAFPLRDEMVPVVPLANVLEGREALRKDIEQMAVISLPGETWGIILDSIVRYATLGYRQLPDNLSSLKEVQGLVYDEKFNLVPILNIPSIIGHIRRLRSIEFRNRFQEGDLSGRNILLVDDSEVSRQTLSRVLTEGGFTVEVAEDGIAALDILHTKYFHLVISDDDMPRMDGITFVENLRKEPEYSRVPVMVMIAERHGELEARFRTVGIRDFHRKADFDRQAILRDTRRLLAEG